VGEIVQILSLSQPRLSHHLKALTGAGLVERLPEGSFVFYRAASGGDGRSVSGLLFNQLGVDVPELQRDAERLDEISASRAASAQAYFSSVADNWDAIRTLHYPNEAIEQALLEIAGPGPFRRVVDFGTGTGRMLTLFAPLAAEAEGIDLSHHMLTVARANLERDGSPVARVRQGDVTAVPFEDASADLVIIHQVLHYVDAPNRVIAEAGRILQPGGRLLVVDFAPHDLEVPQDRARPSQTWSVAGSDGTLGFRCRTEAVRAACVRSTTRKRTRSDGPYMDRRKAHRSAGVRCMSISTPHVSFEFFPPKSDAMANRLVGHGATP
jgi:SAM-dependent methyltransferase